MNSLTMAIVGSSIVLNLICLWYIASLLRKYIPFSTDLEDLFDRLSEYGFHIKTVSEMESFYGDEILMNLLRHSRSITEEVNDFRKAYSIADETVDLLEEEGDETNEYQEDERLEQDTIGVVHGRK